MKNKLLNRLRRRAEKQREAEGLPVLNVQKLLAVDVVKKAIETALQAGTDQKPGGDSNR